MVTVVLYRISRAIIATVTEYHIPMRYARARVQVILRRPDFETRLVTSDFC